MGCATLPDSVIRSNAARKAHITRKINKLTAQRAMQTSAGHKAAITRQINQLIADYQSI